MIEENHENNNNESIKLINNTLEIQLQSIDIKQQINDIGMIYGRIFGSNVTKIRNRFNQFFFDNNNDDKCIVLTPITYNLDDTQSQYDFNKTYFAYKSKLIYSNIHKYLFIIDTTNYLDKLNISRVEHYESLSLTELQKLSQTGIIDATSNGLYGNAELKRIYNETSQTFQHKINIRNHWNKVLSALYWNQHVNCILHSDDDSFIGNYNLSIKYWIELTNNASNTFLVLPQDITNHNNILFSNFAYILYDGSVRSNSMKIKSFLLKWFNMRLKPYSWDDQSAMWNTILQYLLENDYHFQKYLDSLSFAEKNRFIQCAEICNLIPIWPKCTGDCWEHIRFNRPSVEAILNKEYQYSIFWTPEVLLSWNYLIENGNYDGYDFSIYPFALNLNWGSMHHEAFSDGDYRFGYFNMKETEKTRLDDIARDHLQFLFDKTYLLHYRYSEIHNQHKYYLNDALPKMKIFTINETFASRPKSQRSLLSKRKIY